MAEIRRLLFRRAFAAAVDAASPLRYMPEFLPGRPAGKTLVLAAGKGAAPMAEVFAALWKHQHTGFVAVPDYAEYDEVVGFKFLGASHPLPDERSVTAGRKFLREAAKLAEGDLAVVLLSGGASSLLCAPPDGVSLADKRAVCEQLLLSGAAIGEFNCVRRHISAIKGGRLAAAAYPAASITLAVSDVPGDSPADIGSGLTVGDERTSGEAVRILDHWVARIPVPVRKFLLSPSSESLPPGDARLSRSKFQLVASPRLALAAAAKVLEDDGYSVVNFGSCIAGEAAAAAAVFTGVARSVMQHGVPVRPPAALLSGGELTVSGAGVGRGGPNTEFALAVALLAADLRSVHAMACDTDGVDGNSGAAGAVVAGGMLVDLDEREKARIALRNHESAAFLEGKNALLGGGPTGVNVNDLRIVIIE